MTASVVMGFQASPILVRLLGLRQLIANQLILWEIAYPAQIDFTSVLMAVPVWLLRLYARPTIKLGSAYLATPVMSFFLIQPASKRPLQTDASQLMQLEYVTPVPPNSYFLQAESARQGTATASPTTNPAIA